MDVATFAQCVRRIRRSSRTRDAPVRRLIALGQKDPFRIAVGTLLSARTRDATLIAVLERLFRVVHAPQDILGQSQARLRAVLRPTGFFRMKERTLRRFAGALIERHDGRVPREMAQLLDLPGVGPKTAGIIMVAAHGTAAIAVDTHVHRIVNRLGLVRTPAPAKTAAALYELLPRRLWRHVNLNLVALGQTVCHPTRPRCASCPVDDLCPKIGTPNPSIERTVTGKPAPSPHAKR